MLEHFVLISEVLQGSVLDLHLVLILLRLSLSLICNLQGLLTILLGLGQG